MQEFKPIRERELVFDEFGKAHVFPDESLRAFIAVGLIWRMKDEKWHCHSSLDMGDWPELARCDFCHSQPIAYEADADSFDMLDGALVSVGSWFACEPCGRCIELNDKQGLEQRSFHYLRQHFADIAHLNIQRNFLTQFWSHYHGIKRCATTYGR